MSNDDAYAIVKTLVEKKADIVAVHKEALSFSLIIRSRRARRCPSIRAH
jgi:hypothetical protein